MAKKLKPVHPGDVLREKVLKPLGMTSRQLAIKLNVPANRIYQIANCSRSMTPDTAERLARYLGTSAEFWLNLQMDYDLRVLREEKGKDIKREVKPRHASEATGATA
jgi:addiction module HigA family antidote